MRRVVTGPGRRTSARVTPLRATKVTSVEISRQTARPAAGKRKLAQRTSNAATAITDTADRVRDLSATAAAPETRIREKGIGEDLPASNPSGMSAGTMIMATSAARKIDRPRPSVESWLAPASPLASSVSSPPHRLGACTVDREAVKARRTPLPRPLGRALRGPTRPLGVGRGRLRRPVCPTGPR